MKIGLKKMLWCFIFSLLLSLTLSGMAYADSVKAPAHPERPNLVWDVTERKTVIVHMVNTTPFNMELTSSPSFVNKNYKNYVQDNCQSCDNTYEPPSIFSPSGLPHKVPAKNGASFVVSWLDTKSDASDVFPDAEMIYTLRNVDSSKHFEQGACPTLVGDVDIHLEFNRVKQTKNLKSDVFKLIMHSASLVVDAVESIELNPVAWAGFLLSAAEIAEDSIAINEKNEDSDQVYFNAFVVSKNGINQIPGIYSVQGSSSDSDTAAQYDGLYTQHGDTQGCPQEYIISAVSMIREQQASDEKLNGHLPVVFVTLSTSDDWQAALDSQAQVSMQASFAGNKITQQMLREGRKGQIAFIKLARTLNISDRNLLHGAYKAIKAHKPLSHGQEAVLANFAAALEKHAVSMQPVTAPKTPINQTPVHKNK